MATVAQLQTLVGNPDVYAVQRENGTYYPVYEPLTPVILRHHLKGDLTVGTYLIRDEDKAKTLVLDFDSGDAALEEAKKVQSVLIDDLGIPARSIGLEFSGNKGYHLWIVASAPLPAAWFRRMGKAALTIAGVKAEVYPKQDSAQGRLGNLVKLPHGVHRVTGKVNEMIGAFPQPAGQSVFKKIVDQLPEEATRTRTFVGTNPLECMAAIQQGCEDGWRNHGMFHFATQLRRAGLEEDVLWAAMVECNSNFDPPLDDEELQDVFRSSAFSGPICDTIPEEHQCSVCPYRQGRLYAKPGQLRFGKEGELAVVALGKRRPNGAIELVHPDLDAGLVRVRNE